MPIESEKMTNSKETSTAVQEQRFRYWNETRPINQGTPTTTETYTLEKTLRNMKSGLEQIGSSVATTVKESAFDYLTYDEFKPICDQILADSDFQKSTIAIDLKSGIDLYKQFLIEYHQKEDDYEKFAYLLNFFVEHNNENVRKKEEKKEGSKEDQGLSHTCSTQEDFVEYWRNHGYPELQREFNILSTGMDFTLWFFKNGAYATPNSTYMNVNGTYLNIRPSFHEESKIIAELRAGWHPVRSEAWQKKMPALSCTVEDLDLSAKKPNALVRQMLDLIVQLDKINKSKHHNMTSEQYSKLSERAKQLLEVRNIIFHGAPGTGKTTVARKIAAELLCVDYDNEEQLNAQLNESHQYEFVQFHPSYDYTDFVEGLRPETTATGNVGFQLYPGTFTKFVNEARTNPDQNFVIVIDEINRGDLSKIFGELFFSIDPDYRGKKGSVDTQYANLHSLAYKERGGLDAGQKFYIPENVYIIGTMNDIDRSVDSFDFAMRRRFTFIEITAEESASALDGTPNGGRAKSLMTSVNSKISEFLGTDYILGVGYFLKIAQSVDEDAPLELWKNHLEPLLTDYLRGMDDADGKLQEIREAFDKGDPSNTTDQPAQGDAAPTTGSDLGSSEA
ncbi:McrB family protein [Bifidobacterium asteroides]|uniref:Endonuclease n=1 Tax=Bifidobacterium asteroides TaxID=1684 RepID=A0A2N3RBE5_9BIFI|nr:AAA family ATPase [Bifidobacterium asteroides]PKV09797.1 endonuclease [Bifidobacterium asteroides]